MNNKKKTALVIIAAALAVIAVGLVIWIAWADRAIETVEYNIESECLPAAFEGFRIAQVSDLHNTEFGKDNEKLLSLISAAEPDIIVVTGDIIDIYGIDEEKIAVSFLERATEIAPCYYVSGNHEGRGEPGEFEALCESFEAISVTVLRGETVELEREGDLINIMGIDDPNFGLSVEESVTGRMPQGYTVLLSHRPENFSTYVDAGSDLVFTGHAHGGQFILPFIGGIYSPGEGLLPEYYEGVHIKGDTSMIVSRGLGNSAFPFRLNNRPQLIVAVLGCEK